MITTRPWLGVPGLTRTTLVALVLGASVIGAAVLGLKLIANGLWLGYLAAVVLGLIQGLLVLVLRRGAAGEAVALVLALLVSVPVLLIVVAMTTSFEWS